jgi:peptide/nickel transport system substrate-binding protein
VQIFETLYAPNASYAPVPLLASDLPTVSEDGLVHRIPLRSDVTFHNGEPMSAGDVVASLNRWGAVSVIGQGLYVQVEDVRAVDEETVEIRLNSPNNDLARLLAVPVSAAAIMPQSIIDAVGENVIEADQDIVGTGPFTLKEWARGNYVELAAFDEYAPPPNAAEGGLAGDKTPTLSGVRLTFNPDATSRVSGVETGQVDVALEVPGDSYDSVTAMDGVETTVISPYYSAFALLNTSRPPFDDPDVRDAAHFAIDKERTLLAMMGNEAMFDLSGGIYPKGMDILYSAAGTEDYDEFDIERAKSLLEGSSYDGSQILLMTSQEIGYLYDATVTVADGLKQAGFNVKIDVSEWANVVSRIGDPQAWDLFITAFGIGYLTPTGHQHFTGFSPFEGWYATDGEARGVLDEWNVAESDDERRRIMNDLQVQFFEDRPAVKLGDYNLLIASRDDVEIEAQEFYWPTYWTFHWRQGG